MLYMIIEKFYPGKVKLLYERFQQKGRMLPDGLVYIDSWINEPVTVCYQLMQCDEEAKIHEWIQCWNDVAEFEIIPVISSAQAREKIFASEGS